MENKILGLAYRHCNKQHLVETYAVIYEDGNFIYRQLKKYEKVFNNAIIEELEKTGFKNMYYWNNVITEIIRDEIKNVKK